MAAKAKTADAQAPEIFASLDNYLGTFAPAMADRVSTALKPLFDPSVDRLSPEVRALATCTPKPYPPQAVVVESLLRALATRDSLWLCGEMGTGKCGRNDAKVLTPTGWVEIGSIKVGDKVVNPDGTIVPVIGVYPQGDKAMFRVRFSDGSSTVTCDEHLWLVNTPLRKWRGQDSRVFTLRDIMDKGLTHANGNHQHFIPMVMPADLSHPDPRPIDPYILGLLLGNAYLDGSPQFSTPDAELVEALQASLPVTVRRTSKYDYRLVGPGRGLENPLMTDLRSLGLWGCLSETKFVPPQYLWSSASDRLALLQGLCDTDGHATGTSGARGSGQASNVEYSTVSPRLRDAVVFLVQSLGGTVSIATLNAPAYTYRGEQRTGQIAYRMLLSLSSDICPFRLRRKADKYDGPAKYGPSRCIVAVEPEGSAPATCIAVGHPNQLYVTDDFIVTHNTPMGAWLASCMEKRRGRPQRIVLTCPNQLVRKWKRHFESIMPSARVVIVRNYKELGPLGRERYQVRKEISHADGSTSTQLSWRWKKPDKTEVLIIPRDKGKLGYAWSSGVNVVTRLISHSEGHKIVHDKVLCFRCPKCGQEPKKEDGTTYGLADFVNRNGKLTRKMHCSAKLFVEPRIDEQSGRPVLLRVYKGGEPLIEARPKKKNEPCEQMCCGEPLWQAFNGRPSAFAHRCMPTPGISPRKIAPCSFLRKMGMRFDIYIADEVHELKGDGTLQGQMFADLCGISGKVLMMTGTMIGGYAENLLHLLWRSIGHRLIEDGLVHDHAGYEDFVKRYGVLQTITRYTAKDQKQDHTDLIRGRGKKSSTRTKSLPGVSPVLFVNFLLDQCAFIRLMEMHSHLPKFHERVHTVYMDRDQDSALAGMQKKFAEHRERVRPCRAWSAARACFLRWPDKPWVDPYTVYDRDEDWNLIEAFKVPSLPKREYPKERRVRRLVTRNKLRNRKTWIYTELSGQGKTPVWDWMEYLRSYLTSHGLKVAVLRAESQGGPSPEDREEWIEKTAADVDCVISNPTLVKTGLDLLWFPSIVYAFPGDKTYDLRQASRRAWRLGQTETCEVDYVVSKGARSRSMQEAALSLMCDKMAAALAIEGEFSSDGLASMAGGDDIASQLARFIDGRLDKLDSASTAMERYRKKLEACMPDLATELPATTLEGSRRPEVDVPELSPDFCDLVDLSSPIDPIESTKALLAAMGVPLVAPTPAAPVLAPAPAPEPDLGEAAAIFSAPSAVSACEPEGISERKAWRRQALSNVLGLGIVGSGDVVSGGGVWYQVVSKRRGTVRERNFFEFAQAHPNGLIAFVEPRSEVGPTTSADSTTVNGVEYIVSIMAVSAYLAGERTPGPAMARSCA